MRTVIVRLVEVPSDGHLRGVVEILGTDRPVPFADDDQLLAVLRTAVDGCGDVVQADDLNPT